MNKETPDNSEAIKDAIVASVNQTLQTRVAERFSEEIFHNPEHSENVERISAELLTLIEEVDPTMVTKDDKIVAKTVANGHDIVINYVGVSNKMKEGPDGETVPNPMYGTRSRFRGFEKGDVVLMKGAEDIVGNERASADEILEVISDQDPDQIVYTSEVVDKVMDGVRVTFPEFSFSKIPADRVHIKYSEGGADETEENSKKLKYEDVEQYLGPEGRGLRIFQKYLTSESPISSLAIALADLAHGGMSAPLEFEKTGDREYREMHDKIQFEINQGIEKLFDERKREIIKDMVAWLRLQIQFLIWQKINFENIISSNEAINSSEHGDQIRDALKSRFSHFDENIVASIKRYESHSREIVGDENEIGNGKLAESLAVLAREFGYAV